MKKLISDLFSISFLAEKKPDVCHLQFTKKRKKKKKKNSFSPFENRENTPHCNIHGTKYPPDVPKKSNMTPKNDIREISRV